MDQVIILAAGESKRMGKPKALLPFGNQLAIERIVTVCAQAGIAEPIIVLGAHEKTIREAAQLGKAKLVSNPDWEKGRSSSVKAGWKALAPTVSWFLIWPVDQPLVELQTVQQLIMAPTEQEHRIVVPEFQGKRGHPIRLSADAQIRREIDSLSDSDPLHLVVRKDPQRIFTVQVQDPAISQNLNTPQDYERALREFTPRA